MRRLLAASTLVLLGPGCVFAVIDSDDGASDDGDDTGDATSAGEATDGSTSSADSTATTSGTADGSGTASSGGSGNDATSGSAGSEATGGDGDGDGDGDIDGTGGGCAATEMFCVDNEDCCSGFCYLGYQSIGPDGMACKAGCLGVDDIGGCDDDDDCCGLGYCQHFGQSGVCVFDG